MKYFTALVFLFAANFLAFSQTSSAFNYQSAVRNPDGTPVADQAISIALAILSGDANGTVVYSETHQVTTSSLGLFSVQVGNGNAPSSDFDEINWSGANHYLSVSVDVSGGSNYVLLGVTQLLSVPYALYAKNGSVWRKENFMVGGLYEIDGIHYTTGGSDMFFGRTVQNALDFPENPQFRMTQRYSQQDTSAISLTLLRRAEYNSEPTFEFSYASGEGAGRNLAFRANGLTRWFAGGDGKMGINTSTPGAALQVNEGDVYIEDINRGVIMKSPNGQCWRVTVSNTGQLVPTAITCPL